MTKPRNPVVRAVIAHPNRNAGRHLVGKSRLSSLDVVDVTEDVLDPEVEGEGNTTQEQDQAPDES